MYSYNISSNYIQQKAPAAATSNDIRKRTYQHTSVRHQPHSHLQFYQLKMTILPQPHTHTHAHKDNKPFFFYMWYDNVHKSFIVNGKVIKYGRNDDGIRYWSDAAQVFPIHVPVFVHVKVKYIVCVYISFFIYIPT